MGVEYLLAAGMQAQVDWLVWMLACLGRLRSEGTGWKKNKNEGHHESANLVGLQMLERFVGLVITWFGFGLSAEPLVL